MKPSQYQILLKAERLRSDAETLEKMIDQHNEDAQISTGRPAGVSLIEEIVCDLNALVQSLKQQVEE